MDRNAYSVTVVVLAIALALGGCIPSAQLRLHIAAGSKQPTEFRSALIGAITRNGFVADVYSDTSSDIAPFRELGAISVATFSTSISNRVSIQLEIDKSYQHAELWVTEQATKNLSSTTLAALRGIVLDLEGTLGSANISIAQSKEPGSD